MPYVVRDLDDKCILLCACLQNATENGGNVSEHLALRSHVPFIIAPDRASILTKENMLTLRVSQLNLSAVVRSLGVNKNWASTLLAEARKATNGRLHGNGANAATVNEAATSDGAKGQTKRKATDNVNGGGNKEKGPKAKKAKLVGASESKEESGVDGC